MKSLVVKIVPNRELHTAAKTSKSFPVFSAIEQRKGAFWAKEINYKRNQESGKSETFWKLFESMDGEEIRQGTAWGDGEKTIESMSNESTALLHLSVIES